MDTTQGTPGPEDSGVADYGRAGPTVVRLLLGARLRRLRQAAGITRDSAGNAIRASGSKISRLELGRTGFKQRDVSELLTLYGVADDAERAVLLSLARQANSAGWWHTYSEVLPAWFEPYLGLEQAASIYPQLRRAVHSRAAADPGLRTGGGPARGRPLRGRH